MLYFFIVPPTKQKVDRIGTGVAGFGCKGIVRVMLPLAEVGNRIIGGYLFLARERRGSQSVLVLR